MRCISLLLPLLTVSLGVACDDLTGPEAVAGTYVLSTVSGEPLPYRVNAGDDYTEITSSYMRLSADTAFFFSMATTASIQGEITAAEDTATGTFVLVEATIEFYFPGADIVYHCCPDPRMISGPITGSIAGDTLTIVFFEGKPWVLVKE